MTICVMILPTLFATRRNVVQKKLFVKQRVIAVVMNYRPLNIISHVSRTISKI
ncbi:hypothetical protein EVA_17789 [gut metagenome]|uniref:Uncharacterized protein n=1 Tax=gut metagenome TaxID=749906 RepID=J9FI59_9ZZZZ